MCVYIHVYIRIYAHTYITVHASIIPKASSARAWGFQLFFAKGPAGWGSGRCGLGGPWSPLGCSWDFIRGLNMEAYGAEYRAYMRVLSGLTKACIYTHSIIRCMFLYTYTCTSMYIDTDTYGHSPTTRTPLKHTVHTDTNAVFSESNFGAVSTD